MNASRGEEESQQGTQGRKALVKSKHRARESQPSGDVSDLITKAVDNAFSRVMDIIKAFCHQDSTRASTSKHVKRFRTSSPPSSG